MEPGRRLLFVIAVVVEGIHAQPKFVTIKDPVPENEPFVSPQPFTLGHNLTLRCFFPQTKPEYPYENITDLTSMRIQKLNDSNQLNRQTLKIILRVSAQRFRTVVGNDFGRDIFVEYKNLISPSITTTKEEKWRVRNSTGIMAKVNDAHCSDIGMYLCSAQFLKEGNVKGASQRMFYADIVDHKPVLVVTASSWPFVLNTNINVSCTARGSANATIELKIKPEGGSKFLDLPTASVNLAPHLTGQWPMTDIINESRPTLGVCPPVRFYETKALLRFQIEWLSMIKSEIQCVVTRKTESDNIMMKGWPPGGPPPTWENITESHLNLSSCAGSKGNKCVPNIGGGPV